MTSVVLSGCPCPENKIYAFNVNGLEEKLNDNIVDIPQDTKVLSNVSIDFINSSLDSIIWYKGDINGNVTYNSSNETLTFSGDIPDGNLELRVNASSDKGIISRVFSGITYGPSNCKVYDNEESFNSENGGINLVSGISDSGKNYFLSGDKLTYTEQDIKDIFTGKSYENSISKAVQFVSGKSDITDEMVVFWKNISNNHYKSITNVPELKDFCSRDPYNPDNF